MNNELKKGFQVFQMYEPIYDSIGVLSVTFRDIFPNPVMWRLKCSRKKFRRNK